MADKAMNKAHDAELATWLRDLPEQMYDRLARVGLVELRAAEVVVTLDDLLVRFEAAAAVKPATRAACRQTTTSLRETLGAGKPLKALTASDADAWRKAIADSELAPATVAKRVHVARGSSRERSGGA